MLHTPLGRNKFVLEPIDQHHHLYTDTRTPLQPKVQVWALQGAHYDYTHPTVAVGASYVPDLAEEADSNAFARVRCLSYLATVMVLLQVAPEEAEMALPLKYRVGVGEEERWHLLGSYPAQKLHRAQKSNRSQHSLRSFLEARVACPVDDLALAMPLRYVDWARHLGGVQFEYCSERGADRTAQEMGVDCGWMLRRMLVVFEELQAVSSEEAELQALLVWRELYEKCSATMVHIKG